MATLLALYRLNDNRIAISGLRDPDGAPLTGGACSVTLHDANGVPITGQSWPVVLTWDNVNKRFTGQIDATINVAIGDEVTIFIDGTTAGGIRFYDEQTATVRLPTIP